MWACWGGGEENLEGDNFLGYSIKRGKGGEEEGEGENGGEEGEGGRVFTDVTRSVHLHC